MKPIWEWLWRWLPDRCEVPDCNRNGVRGNENQVGGRVVCDDCLSDMMLSGNFPNRKQDIT